MSKMKRWHVVNWKKKRWRRIEEKGVAVSYEFSIDSTFSAAGLQPALHFLVTPLPASAAGLCPYMAAAGSQSAQSRQLIQTASVRDEKGGNCKQKWTALHRAKQYSPLAQTNLLAGLKQKKSGATIQQSKAAHVTFTQLFRGTGCTLQYRIGVVFQWQTERVGSWLRCRGGETERKRMTENDMKRKWK